MDIFEGTPKEKFFDILFNANRNSVETEIESLLLRLVILEKLCLDTKIKQTQISSLLSEEPQLIEDGLNDIYIELTANILSNNE